ncbi:ATP-binding protein [Comamonas aquatilis]|uniref:COG4315 family predicted lipoprotein n=1 Tax=Comamonas aquatilis TaxID=1778406 RepID=UPI0039EF0852
MFRIASLTILSAALLAACSTAAVTPAKSPATVMNGALVGPNQMTLYVFDKDAAGSGKSVCNGGCATNWPPLMAPAGAAAMGDWSVVTRDDGSKQWAYKGRPLYFWVKDAKPGDMTGDGFLNNTWHTAKP